MTRFIDRHPSLLWLVTFLATMLSGIVVVACLAVASGCGSAAQRAVSSVAVVAVAADQANSIAYEAIADETGAEVRASGGTFDDWCAAMAEPWDTCSRVECAVEALAELAYTGQAVLDAGDELDGRWFAAACAALAVADDAWSAAESPPEVLSQARSLVCGLADGAHAGPPECRDPGPVPACEDPEEVSR